MDQPEDRAENRNLIEMSPLYNWKQLFYITITIPLLLIIIQDPFCQSQLNSKVCMRACGKF